ncbi:MAG: GTP-binding protein [Candidatus Tectimicrobiota bacterium]
MTTKRVPVLVVSGFLGAGKTTLVRHLLQEAQRTGVRMAVISNEFGALGIDKALLGEDEAAYVELEGGCVCCQLSDTLLETLQLLWERAQPDRIIIETSGVALPFDTQLNLWREPINAWVDDDMAVVVVNAEQLAEGRDLEGTFEDQVSGADLLVLNKVDLVAPALLSSLEQQLASLAPDTPCLHATQGQVSSAVLFPPDLQGRRAQRRATPQAPAPHQHTAFHTQTLSVPTGVDPELLTTRLQALGALRAKGFVETTDGLRLVQGVGRRLELTPVNQRPPAELLGLVVVITRAEAGAPPGL